jgi:hypothetical protein
MPSHALCPCVTLQNVTDTYVHYHQGIVLGQCDRIDLFHAPVSTYQPRRLQTIVALRSKRQASYCSGASV